MNKLILIATLFLVMSHPIDTKQCKWVQYGGDWVKVCRMVELPIFRHPGGK